MKTTAAILSLISLCAAAAVEGVSPRAAKAVPVEIDSRAVAGGFGATCWDFAMDHTYFYATCSSGGAGSPAIRSAVNLSECQLTCMAGSVLYSGQV